jgi:hypothetical protein
MTEIDGYVTIRVTKGLAHVSLRLRSDLFKGPFCHIVHGDFTAVLPKHSKNFSLVDALSIGVDRMQRNFDLMRQQIDAWHQTQITGRASGVA